MTLISDQIPLPHQQPGPCSIKPFLKWAGGKHRLVTRILAHLPKTGRFIEPFTGSAAVAINAPQATILANDQNDDLITLYNHVRTQTDQLLNELTSLFTPASNTQATFLTLRTEFNESRTPTLRRSALFVYLNRHGFNGLCRYNAKGAFNVPFGSYTGPNIPEREIRTFAIRARNIRFSCGDFEPLLDEATAGDAVYCDPPYVPLSASASFTSYEKGGFGLSEQERLALAARRAVRRGATVAISNHDTPETRKLYAGSQIDAFPVQRMISAKGADRWAAKEIIAVFVSQ